MHRLTADERRFYSAPRTTAKIGAAIAAGESRWAYGSVTAGEWPVLQDGEFRTLWVAKVGSDALIVPGLVPWS